MTSRISSLRAALERIRDAEVNGLSNVARFALAADDATATSEPTCGASAREDLLRRAADRVDCFMGDSCTSATCDAHAIASELRAAIEHDRATRGTGLPGNIKRLIDSFNGDIAHLRAQLDRATRGTP